LKSGYLKLIVVCREMKTYHVHPIFLGNLGKVIALSKDEDSSLKFQPALKDGTFEELRRRMKNVVETLSKLCRRNKKP
jgi:hypothetical protein